MGNRTVKLEVDKSQKAPANPQNVRNSKFSEIKKPKKIVC